MNESKTEPSAAGELDHNQGARATRSVSPATPKVLLLGVGLLLGGVMGMCLCAGLAGIATAAVASEQRQIEAVVHSALSLLRDHEIDQSYALFAAAAQSPALRSNLELTSAGANYLLYKGYRSVQVDMANIGFEFYDEASGLVGRVMGTVTYDRGDTTTFDAVLLKENGHWKLLTVNVTIPPARYDDFFGAAP
jgi:hypothetical protein